MSQTRFDDRMLTLQHIARALRAVGLTPTVDGDHKSGELICDLNGFVLVITAAALLDKEK